MKIMDQPPNPKEARQFSTLPLCYQEEIGGTLFLGNDKLSDQLWNLEYTPILERFNISYEYEAKNLTDQKVAKANLTEYHVSCKNDRSSGKEDSIHELENYILVFYPGVLKWHEHRHLHRSWKNSQVVSLIS